MKGKHTRLLTLVYCALVAALLGVFSQLMIPMTPVPINLATLAVMLGALLLGKSYGTLAVLCYLLLGAAGVPVFSGLRGGVSALLGPTGGYLVGYLPYAFLAGMGAARKSFAQRCLFCLLGTIACYALGTALYVIQSGNTLGVSLAYCVLPFLPGDAVKLLLAAWLSPRLQKAVKR